MKRKPEREWHLYYTKAATTRALVRVLRKLKRNSPDLIHGGFEDHQGGKCLASWFGHELGMTGPEFIAWSGIPGASEVVIAWDADPVRFRAEILKALKLEIFYRRGGRPCRESVTSSRSSLA